MENTEAYVAYCIDNARLFSSSGGVFYCLAKKIIELGGVVYGAAYNDNFNVNHIMVNNVEDLVKLQGSKYTQSNTGNCYKQIKVLLEKSTLVLFSGLSCQIKGLKSYLNKDYDNLYLIDMVCHSVPTSNAWNKYVQYRANHDNNGKLPTSINMRSKESGWSYYNYSIVFDYGNGNKYVSLSEDDIFMKLFIGGYISKESCYKCKFKGMQRENDITLGDAWGVWDYLPEMDDNIGTSLVLCHTEKGDNLLKRIKDQLVIKNVEIERVIANNPAITNVCKKPKKAKNVSNAIDEGKYDKAIQMLDGNNICNRIIEGLKALFDE